jgi:23S rRNA (uracil1939-C5)-methyltransferase
VQPRCPVVGRCGGCPWQDVEYAAQLEAKREALVRDLRARPALAGVEVAPVEPISAEPYGYRTKIQMPVGGRPGGLAVGFFAPGTKDLVAVGDCAVQHPEGNRIVREARAILDRARVAPYDEARHAGILRYILVRLDGGGGRAALTLVCRTPALIGRRDLIARLAAIRGVTGVYLNVQPARGNVVLGRETVRLAGRERLLLEVAGRVFLVSPTAFFQTSAAGAEALVERVRSRLAGPYDVLVDLYCGVGLFARTLADRAKRIVGVEENRAAVEDARAGLRLEATRRANAPGGEPASEARIELVAAPVEAWIAGAGLRADAVVLDPPRAGCPAGVLEGIAARLRPREIAYVSCNPAALARDLEVLALKGYRVHGVHPIDLFPHTPHVECVAHLSRAVPVLSAHALCP